VTDRHADATALVHDLRGGDRSPVEAVQICLDRIDERDGALQAFASVEADGALERARKLESEVAGGATPGPLHGLPFAIKGNMCAEGFVTNCGSRILADYRAPYTATCVQRMIDAGAIPVGVTHMDEFAMGSSGENSAYAASKNPWDHSRIPGGSSSGSAAAVAARIVPVALGSDTGGSVRQPAALCGITGFKPTYGRVSRYGLVAFGSSLDQISPLTPSVRDAQLIMSVISGADPFDSTCGHEPALAADQPPLHDLKGLRLGVPREYLPDSLDPRMREQIEAAIDHMVALGAERVDITLPHTEHAIPTYYVVATAEASSNLARYDGVRYGQRVEGDGSLLGMFAATRDAGFGDEVKRRILLGTYVLSSGYHDAWYGRALKVRGLLLEEFNTAFESVDLIVGPTSPTPAFRLGERTADPVAMYLSDVLTAPASLAGLPAISVPAGFVSEGGKELPIGLQVIGTRGSDARLLAATRVYQESTAHLREPDGFQNEKAPDE